MPSENHEALQVLQRPIAPIGVVLLGIVGQVEQGRVAPNPERPAQLRAILGRAVDGGDVQLEEKFEVQLFPRWLQVLAVRAPGREKLDEPGLATEHGVRVGVDDKAMVQSRVELERVHLVLI